MEMKVKIGQAEQESFVAAYLLKFENGLVLRTNKNLIWAGKEETNTVKQQFQEIVQTLKNAGFVVEGEIS